MAISRRRLLQVLGAAPPPVTAPPSVAAGPAAPPPAKPESIEEGVSSVKAQVHGISEAVWPEMEARIRKQLANGIPVETIVMWIEEAKKLQAGLFPEG